MTRLRPDRRALEREIRRVVAEWRQLWRDDTTGARLVLHAMLEEPLRLTPIREPGRRGCLFEGAVTFGDPLTGVVARPCDGVPGRNRRKGHPHYGAYRSPAT